MKNKGACQGCGKREGEPLTYRPKGKSKRVTVTLELEPYELLDFGQRLLCQQCLQFARKDCFRIANACRIVEGRSPR